MLILTRKVDQGLVIGGNITVAILGIDRDSVKIGIDAPKEIQILRNELAERMQAQ
jgi:carbon storage regulator